MENAKTYLIAGASTGIGLQIALKLIDAGYCVIALSRSRGNLPEHASVTYFEYDFSSDAPLPEVSAALNGIVYCPGTITLKPFRTLKESDLNNDFQINVAGAFRTVREYRDKLKGAEASIVLFSSVAAQTGMPFHVSIATSKAAVEGLTRSLAAELASDVRVNCIAPSLTDTPLATTLLNSDAKRKANAEPHPLKTIGNAVNFADAAIFLMQQATWMTGQVLKIDGGLGTVLK